MTAAIVVQDLVVEFTGLRALDRISFALPKGSITALVGPNGAGKTTLMRCIVALDRPFSGTLTVDGVDALAQPRELHRRVGYLSDNFGLYDDMSVLQCLQYAAGAHGLRGAVREARVAALIEQVGVQPLLGRRAGTLSRGERQRVGLAQALVHEPAVLVLDEPASGLDPGARQDLSALLQRLKRAGKTIVVSSHILAELEDYSDWMLTLDRGSLRGFVPVHQAPSEGLRYLHCRLVGDVAQARHVAAQIEGVTSIESGEQSLVLGWTRDEAAQVELLRKLLDGGVGVVALETAGNRMQDVYLAQLGTQAGAAHEPQS